MTSRLIRLSYHRVVHHGWNNTLIKTTGELADTHTYTIFQFEMQGQNQSVNPMNPDALSQSHTQRI